MDDVLKAGESKADAFKRLGTLRVQKVLTSLRVLGNCSNNSNYEYTQEQVDKMMAAIETATIALKAKFSPKEKTVERAFTL